MTLPIEALAAELPKINLRPCPDCGAEYVPLIEGKPTLYRRHATECTRSAR